MIRPPCVFSATVAPVLPSLTIFLVDEIREVSTGGKRSPGTAAGASSFSELRGHAMLSPHQARTLRKFSRLGLDWVEAKMSGVGDRTWNTLITLTSVIIAGMTTPSQPI